MAPCPINATNQLPGNIGTGINNEAAAKSEKKATAIMPFTFVSAPYHTFTF